MTGGSGVRLSYHFYVLLVRYTAKFGVLSIKHHSTIFEILFTKNIIADLILKNSKKVYYEYYLLIFLYMHLL